VTISFPRPLGEITYEFDYFSGSGVLVYAEDVLVDDTLRIAWNVSQDRTPIWGYASQYFNALADGVIIVNGALWVAYKEAAYLPLILNYIAQRRSDWRAGSFGGDYFSSPGITNRLASGGLEESAEAWQAAGGGRGGRVSRANIETLLRLESQDPEDASTRRELQRMLLQLGAMSDSEFERVAEVFEDAVWCGVNSTVGSEEGGQAGGRRDVMSGNLSGGPERFLAHRRVDQYPPIDIIVTFGDMNNPAANHTVQRLMDVTFTGTEFAAIENTGEPVIVRYDFIARNMA